jgi:hypothetical protein
VRGLHQLADGSANGLLGGLRLGAPAGRAGDAIDSPKECAEPEGQRFLLLFVRRVVGGSGNRGVVHVAIAVSHFVYRIVRGGFVCVGDLVHGRFPETGLTHSKWTRAARNN